MENKTKIFILVGFILLCAAIACVFALYTKKGATLGSIDESRVIQIIKNKFPELKEYPSDKLPPRSIKTKKVDNGWFAAFIQEGSGVPVIQAKCFFVDNTGKVNNTGFYFPKNSQAGFDDFSIINCESKNSNSGGQIPDVPGVVGGDKDAHGCVGSAGYSWCAVKNKCLRIWEESCEANSGGMSCALETCHGLDISCGSNAPDVCTQIYGIGDKCLQYAKCGVQNGKCQQIQNTQFTECKSCVQKCIAENKTNNNGLFECESKCK